MPSERCHFGVRPDDDLHREERCILHEGHGGEHEFHCAAERRFEQAGLDRAGRPKPTPPPRDHGRSFTHENPLPASSPPVRPPPQDDREHTAFRDESSAAGVVTKRIDRGDGASELSFYAIGPKRSTYGEAAADLQRLTGAVTTGGGAQ
jgi:hypothetical protein